MRLEAAKVGFVYLTQSPDPPLMDFKAFYCAAAAVRAHADPYLTEPLRSCERLPSAIGLFQTHGAVVVPAPLPAYLFALLLPLTQLPYDAAALLWTLLSLALLLVGLTRLRALTGDSHSTFIALFGLSVGIVALVLGQLVVIAIGALCLAADALERERPVAAAWWCSLALIEPHLGAAACGALALAAPRARLPLLTACVLLAGAAFAAVGVSGNLEYLTRVLPAAAQVNAHDVGQYGFLSLLMTLGVPSALAFDLARGAFALALIASCALARPLARALNSDAAIVLFPPALMLLAEPYLHLSQVAIALPALLLLRSREPRLAASLTTALVLVALPLPEIITVPRIMLPLSAIAAFIVARERFSPLASALHATLVVAIVLALVGFSSPLQPTPGSLLDDPHALAETAWGSLLNLKGRLDPAWVLALHLPTWLGLLSLLTVALPLARLRTARETAA